MLFFLLFLPTQSKKTILKLSYFIVQTKRIDQCRFHFDVDALHLVVAKLGNGNVFAMFELSYLV